jgi:L-asparaginase / beta-aspartyl-peptidase
MLAKGQSSISMARSVHIYLCNFFVLALLIFANLKNELEASIMLSKPPSSHPEISSTRRGFAVTLLTKVRNPGKLARALYLSPDKGPHAFLSGPNAEKLAESLGEELVDPSYFFTEHRWEEHMRGLGLPRPTTISTDSLHALDLYPTGTVGAVALDAKGCIAAVTSTGGRTNKLVGRIGDTPIFGAGFWAEEWNGGDGGTQAVGISGTGDGDVSCTLPFMYLCDLASISLDKQPRRPLDIE